MTYLKQQAINTYKKEYDQEYIDYFGKVKQCTERKINEILKMDNQYYFFLKDLWEKHRSSNEFYNHCFKDYKTSVKQLQNYGQFFTNNKLEFHLPPWYTEIALGLTAVFGPEVFNTVITNDLSFISIPDFNKFIDLLYKRSVECDW